MDRKLMQQLKDDNIEIDNYQVDSPPEKKKWNDCVLGVIRSKVGQLLLCILVVIDAVVIVAEIVIEVRSLTRQVEVRDRHVQLLSTFLLESNSELRIWWNRSTVAWAASAKPVQRTEELLALYEMSRSAGPCEQLSQHNCSDSGPRNASAHGRRRLPSEHEDEFQSLEGAAHWMHLISAVILCVFVAEVFVKLVCLGFRRFFKEKLEIIDGSVIIISFLVDTIILMDSTTNPGTSVMIILLLWRIVRLINGFMMHEKQRDEKRIRILAEARKAALADLQNVHSDKALLELQLTKYRELCVTLGASSTQLSQCICAALPPAGDDSTVSRVASRTSLRSRAKGSDGLLSKLHKKSATSLSRACTSSSHRGSVRPNEHNCAHAATATATETETTTRKSRTEKESESETETDAKGSSICDCAAEETAVAAPVKFTLNECNEPDDSATALLQCDKTDRTNSACQSSNSNNNDASAVAQQPAESS